MIEAVTVCLDYADFLAETLPLLHQQVDRVVVVTAERDADTLDVVASVPGVVAVTTDSFWHDGAKFRKGAAINAGLAKLSRSDWLLHVDADIAIRNDLRSRLHSLRKDTLYGCHRVSLRGRDAYAGVRADVPVAAQFEPRDAEFLRPVDGEPPVPLGFFQLWHESQHRPYPEFSPNAGKDDLRFSRSFDRRAVIPDLVVYHLESADHEACANWRGRATEQF